jgi:hypothetical protein
LNKGDIHNILAKDGGNLAGTSIQSIQSDNDSKSFACYAGSAPKPYDLGLLPFHIMLTLGYAFVTFYSLKHARS